MLEKDNKNLPVIGPSALVSVGDHAENVPAKIDTGAEASAIWASNIRIEEDGMLKFTLFGEDSPFYNGEEISTKEYKVIVTRSAMGQEQIRYRVHIPVKIAGHKIRVLFSLADRSKNSFPILIGRRTLKGKFIVDVSLPDIEYERKPKTMDVKLKDFKKDPHGFHKKYVEGKD